jgi:hypothetical protein
MKLLALTLVLCLTAGLFAGAASARPGAGPAFAEPESSADAKARGGKRVIPPKPNIGPAGAAGQGEHSSSWSRRPAYAAPWAEPSAKSNVPARPGSPQAVAAGAGHGSLGAFFFWIVVGFALFVLVTWGSQLARNREDDVWTSSKPAGWSPAPGPPADDESDDQP